MRLLIVTDAWRPQVNGVVTTLEALAGELAWMRHEPLVVGPDLAPTLPCPGDKGLRLAIGGRRPLKRLMDSYRPDAVHVATEGPMGLAARSLCLEGGRPFTTSYHTRFPEYLRARYGVPSRATRTYLRWFHRPSAAVLAATPTLKEELERQGYQRVVLWGRGVDTRLFKPVAVPDNGDATPIWLYVGRVAPEKNLDAFLSLDLPGTKWVAGDGPARAELERRYPRARFWGNVRPRDLARLYSAADCFVFPSRTDTFGLVLLEALACGTPVAAYPVPGPRDVLRDPAVCALDEDLGRAARAALVKSRHACREYALRHGWRACAERFLEAIGEPVRPIAA